MDLNDVKKLATLARVDISNEEQKNLLEDLKVILGYVDQIQEVITGEINPAANDLRNILREDVDPHESGEFCFDILNEAPSTEDGYLKVKKIL